MAYLQISELKRRVQALEEQQAKTAGTPLYEERQSLAQAARALARKPVKIDLKEDHEDVDIGMYGNSKHGRNTILDADDEWVLVRIESPKGTKEKLIRIHSIQRITSETEL